MAIFPITVHFSAVAMRSSNELKRPQKSKLHFQY